MELNLSKEDAAFRDEVRTFIAENYSTEMRVPDPELFKAAHRDQYPIWRSGFPHPPLAEDVFGSASALPLETTTAAAHAP
jgi:hypothetical protein